ncbi:MAG: ABC transporter permease, partial [Gemmatimonadota bacterium]|nr:ABC transporter permease [Gemmatimonadota bacterium]
MKTVLRWVIALFPHEFRHRFGEEISESLTAKAAEVRKSRGRLAEIRMWVVQLADLATSAAAERRSSKREGKKGAGIAANVIQDMKFALRLFRRQPLFTGMALVTLSLGIGATTAIFSVVNGVLLEPLPYPENERLVDVSHTAPKLGYDLLSQSRATYLTYRESSRVFDDIGLWDDTFLDVTALAEPERVQVLRVTDGVFPILGFDPILGRRFTENDLVPGAPATAVLSHGYWRRRFAGDPDVLGSTIRIGGENQEIIGILPSGARFMDLDVAVYLPFQINTAEVMLTDFSYGAVARLREGVTLEGANADVARMLPLAAERFPGAISAQMVRNMEIGPRVSFLKDVVVGSVRNVLWVLVGTVALVLLMACANVANLFLVRAEARQREISLRTALGAGRSRITQQLMSESLLVGFVAGLLGLLLARGGLAILLATAPAGLPRLYNIGLDPKAVLFNLAVSLFAGLLFGLFPVIHAFRRDLSAALRSVGRGAAESRSRHRTRTVLAAAQVAMALVLLVGSVLMIRSFRALKD